MKNKLKILVQNHYFQGSAYLLFANIIISLNNYLFHLLTGRALGPSKYSEIAALFSYLTILSLPTAILTNTIIQKIGYTHHRTIVYAYSLENWIIKKVFFWWWIALPIIFLVILILQYANLSSIIIIAILPMLLLNFSVALYESLLQSIHSFLYYTIDVVVANFIKLLGALICFFYYPHLLTVIIFLIISTFVQSLTSRFFFKKQTTTVIKNDIINFSKRLSNVLIDPMIILSTTAIITITLFNNVDIIFAKRFLTSVEAGIYSSWSLFAKILFYGIGPIINISYIFFADRKNQKNSHTILRISLLIFLVGGLIFYLIYAFYAQTITNLLFGPKFMAVAPFMRYAAIYGILYVAIIYLNNFFLARKNQAVLIFPACFLLYIVCLFFIPKSIMGIISLNIVVAIIATSLFLLTYLLKLGNRQLDNNV